MLASGVGLKGLFLASLIRIVVPLYPARDEFLPNLMVLKVAKCVLNLDSGIDARGAGNFEYPKN